MTIDSLEAMVTDFLASLDRAVAAHRRLHPATTIVDKIQYARDVYQMLADEIRIQGLREPIDGIPPLSELYARLKTTELLVSADSGQAPAAK